MNTGVRSSASATKLRVDEDNCNEVLPLPTFARCGRSLVGPLGPIPYSSADLMPLHTFYLRWLLALAWTSLIFIGSTDLLAAQHTSRFVVPILRWLLGDGFTLERANFIHHLIRKGGHLTEYAILCVLLWRALVTVPAFYHSLPDSPAKSGWRFTTSVLLAATYAASDEFHQSFIPTRTASVYDVMIDTCGAIIGLGLYLAVVTQLRRLGNEPTIKPG